MSIFLERACLKRPWNGTAKYALVHPFYYSWRFLKKIQNLNYNVPGGKLNRGMSVVDTVEILKGGELSDDEYFKASVLGWSVELVSCPSPGFYLFENFRNV